MKNIIKSYLTLFLFSGLIIFLDQYSKAYVRSNLALGEFWAPWDWLLPYARIVHWSNTGAAFGIFQGMGTVFAVLAVIISMAIIYYFPRIPESDWIIRAALIMQLGGAVGNLIDRLTIGHVVDFISIGTFPVFNIADSNITVGVGVLLLGIWIQEKRYKQKVAQMKSENQDTSEAVIEKEEV